MTRFEPNEPADDRSGDDADDKRPHALLLGVAADTWQAYNAMEATKRRHFELLNHLENRRLEQQIEPNERERQQLASLLRDHDEQVGRFTAASRALKQQDPAAHLILFRYIGEVGEALSGAQKKAH